MDCSRHLHLPDKIAVVRDKQDGPLEIPDHGGDDIDTLDVQVIRGLIEDEQVGCLVTDHQAAKDEAHFLSATQLHTSLIPSGMGEEESI